MSTVNWKRQDQFWWNFTLPSFQSPWSPPPLPPVLSPPVQEVVTFRIFSHFRHLKVNLNLSHLWKQTWIVGALLSFENRNLALLATYPLHCILPLEPFPGFANVFNHFSPVPLQFLAAERKPRAILVQSVLSTTSAAFQFFLFKFAIYVPETDNTTVSFCFVNFSSFMFMFFRRV